jgi:hypothetical protein
MTFQENTGYSSLSDALAEVVACLFTEVPALLYYRAAAE